CFPDSLIDLILNRCFIRSEDHYPIESGLIHHLYPGGNSQPGWFLSPVGDPLARETGLVYQRLYSEVRALS
ncbi:MAG: hypothetical protein KDK39_20095, partial [Leptospiraceae bacterium]|nr:hypothetical protein [Leptospiraceae bacterium]